MENCIFCKINSKEIPAYVVYEDDICIAFLDISQTTVGHTLVIPKKHYLNFLEVDQATLTHMTKVTQELSKIIVKKLNAKGVNILTNAGEDAGQTVMHFHMHIIPRYGNDALEIHFNENRNKIELNEILSIIRN